MTKKSIALLLLLGHLNLMFTADFSCEVEPLPGETISYARFDLRLLEGIDNPRLILLLMPGFESDGTRLLNDTFWHEFAIRHHAVLLAGTFKSLPIEQREPGRHYNLADKGSGRALLDALTELQKQTGLKGLSELPLLMWGHSAGGQFNHGFACFRPEQVLGYCAIKGGHYPMDPVEGTPQVPALYLAGENDKDYRIEGLRETFQQLSEMGTNPIAFATEQGSGHGVDLCNLLIKPFFDGVVALRLPSPTPASYREMEPVLPGQGIFISSEEGLPASWLPNQHAADVYRQFVNGALHKRGNDEKD